MDALEHDVRLDSGALNELNSPEARALLDTIDSLRELQVGEIVNLPQIIVVGDQSSGKSSVLEGLSRLRFPSKGDLCTRFATELVLRRASETKISVKIDSAQSGSSQQFHRTSFDKDALPEIISEATEKMGIRPGSSKGFSQDILRVEIADPEVYPLTLVDLPGFFHSETAEQTQEGRQIVRTLARHYMKQSKSIILAVIAANNNLANQIVLEEARKHDPNRERTFGVITKPDLAPPGSQDEKKCLELVRGQESIHKLKLGWHVLRNKPEGKEKASVEERDAEEEKFFQESKWTQVTPTSRGIGYLRKKLSKVLLEHIRKTLPGLIEEIESNLMDRQRALEQLGKARSTPEDLRTYLLEIADRFQRLALSGIKGHYATDEFFGALYDDHRKLRALIRGLNRAFHATLVLKGMGREIKWDDDENSPLDYGGLQWIQKDEKPPEYLDQFLRLFDEFQKPTQITESDLREELAKLGAINQGTEFPDLPNGELGFQFFKMQTTPWGSIAEHYLTQVTNIARYFVEELFVHITGTDQQTFKAILMFYVENFFDKKEKDLKDKLAEILRPYVAGYGPPLDAEFHATLSSRTIRRDADRITSLLQEKFPASFTEKGGKGLTRETVQQVISSEEQRRVSEFGTERVIEMAMTHYEMSLKVFTENVVNLAVENCLVSDLPTILTPSMVSRMSDEQLRELASESEDVQEDRKALQRQAMLLREGLRRCQKFRGHERTALPGAFLKSQSSAPGWRSPSPTMEREQNSPTPRSAAHPSSILAKQPSTGSTFTNSWAPSSGSPPGPSSSSSSTAHSFFGTVTPTSNGGVSTPSSSSGNAPITFTFGNQPADASVTPPQSLFGRSTTTNSARPPTFKIKVSS